MKKRIFSTVILICLTVSMLLYSLQILYVTDPYSNSNVDEEGVLHIRTADDFMQFTYLVGNGNEELDAVLENDIDLSGIEGFRRYPMKRYSGAFDGKGHSIKGMYADITSFMIALDAKGVIENLTLYTEVMPLQSGEYGGGAGGIVYRNYGRIINCRVHGKVSGYYYVGGICSENHGLIEDCINLADIIQFENGESYSGTLGIVEGYGAGGICAWNTI